MAIERHPPFTGRTRALLGAVVGPLLAATIVGLVALWPNGNGVRLVSSRSTSATVTAVRRVACEGTDPSAGISCFRPTIRLATGVEAQLNELPQRTVAPGDTVSVTPNPDGSYQLAGRNQSAAFGVVLVIAAIALVVAGWLAGVRALLTIGTAVVVSAAFAVPAVLDGRSPVAVAIVATAVIGVVVIVLTHGVTTRSITALAGALLAIALAGGVARAVDLFASVPAYLHAGGASVPFDGLLLAGVVIGASGAIAQLAVRVVDATWDLRATDPSARWLGIARAGVRGARVDVASTATTLAIAYLGVAVPALTLLTAGVSDAVRGETLAVELGRAAIGIGALAAVVPLTAGIAAAVVVNEARDRQPRDPRRFRARGERAIWESD